MPTFKVPPSLHPRIEAYAGLIVAEYLWRAAEVEKVTSLSVAMSHVATAIFDAAYSKFSKVKYAHLLEQSEADASELIQGRDRIQEREDEIMAQMQAEMDEEETSPQGGQESEEGIHPRGGEDLDIHRKGEDWKPDGGPKTEEDIDRQGEGWKSGEDPEP